MTLTEAVQVQLIISVCSVIGIAITGWYAHKARQHSKSTERAAAQAVDDAATIRSTLTTNNSGSHVKDWMDDISADLREVTRRLTAMDERLTESERARRSTEAACQQGLQRQIDALKGDRWRDTPRPNVN